MSFEESGLYVLVPQHPLAFVADYIIHMTELVALPPSFFLRCLTISQSTVVVAAVAASHLSLPNSLLPWKNHCSLPLLPLPQLGPCC